MRKYNQMLHDVMKHGINKPNRTGIDTRGIFFMTFAHDLRNGFPLLTCKKMPWKSLVGELLGFLRGYQSAAQFRELGCKYWDQNANENKTWLDNSNRIGQDDLGRIYGVQWTKWRQTTIAGFASSTYINQIDILIDTIRHNPNDRRMVVTAWNPGETGQMCLPPCHMIFQCYCDNDNGLHMHMFQRSCDMFLGVPIDIAIYSLLLKILANITGREARNMSFTFGDTHIYKNHFDQVIEQMNRIPLPLPTVELTKQFELVDEIEPNDIILVDYQSHDVIKGEMAV